MRPQTVSQTGVGVSPTLALDIHTVADNDGIFCKVTGAATYSVEMTPDNIFDPTVTPVWFPCGIAALTGATANATGNLIQPARGLRINQTVGAGTVTMTVVQQGLR